MFKKITVAILGLVMLISASVFAADTYEGYTIPVDIEINGSFIKCTEKPIIIGGTTYIPLRAFSDAVGGEISWNNGEKAATLKKDGHTFTFYTGKDYCITDGVRQSHPSVLYNNLTFIPVRAVSEVLGYGVQWDDFYLAVKISAPGVEIPAGCIDYSYTYEDILYLSKITYVESGAEPFRAQLGIAGTVFNRAKSPLFPNTIKEVIFDTKYGVQFPPAHDGKINKTPSKESVIAAKCVLGGVNVVRNSLYFTSAKYAASSWVHKNRPYYTTISSIAFYE